MQVLSSSKTVPFNFYSRGWLSVNSESILFAPVYQGAVQGGILLAKILAVLDVVDVYRDGS